MLWMMLCSQWWLKRLCKALMVAVDWHEESHPVVSCGSREGGTQMWRGAKHGEGSWFSGCMHARCVPGTCVVVNWWNFGESATLWQIREFQYRNSTSFGEFIKLWWTDKTLVSRQNTFLLFTPPWHDIGTTLDELILALRFLAAR